MKTENLFRTHGNKSLVKHEIGTIKCKGMIRVIIESAIKVTCHFLCHIIGFLNTPTPTKT